MIVLISINMHIVSTISNSQNGVILSQFKVESIAIPGRSNFIMASKQT